MKENNSFIIYRGCYQRMKGKIWYNRSCRVEFSKMLDLEYSDNLGLKDVFIFSPSFLSLMANFPNEVIGTPLSVDV
jgi:hypothetical protein